MNKLSFIILNLLLSSNILKYPFIILTVVLFDLEVIPFPSWLPNDFLRAWMVILGVPFILFALYWFFKMYVLIFLYRKNKPDTFTYKFFSRFKSERKFRKKIIFGSLFLDAAMAIIEAIILYSSDLIDDKLYGEKFIDFINIELVFYVLCLTGIFISYLTFYLWLKNTNRLKNFE